jgi:primary-amine oxidase
MSDTTRHRFRSWGALVSVVLLAAAVPVAVNLSADAAGNFSCSSGYQIDEVLTNGARWQMCWERRQNEGIVLHDVVYTPIAGQPVEVLGRAALAEIHVPYDLGQPRFHDLSDYGLGGNMDELDTSDCPTGTLLDDAGTDVVCQTEGPTGYAYKDYDNVAQATSLNLFSTSCIGAYCYVVAWNFDDDGTIRPEVGATGTLQYIDSGPSSGGWPIGGGRRAVAHMHNYY